MFVFREGVQFDPILEPGDVRPRFARGHAHQADLPAQVEHFPESQRDKDIWILDLFPHSLLSDYFSGGN